MAVIRNRLFYFGALCIAFFNNCSQNEMLIEPANSRINELPGYQLVAQGDTYTLKFKENDYFNSITSYLLNSRDSCIDSLVIETAVNLEVSIFDSSRVIVTYDDYQSSNLRFGAVLGPWRNKVSNQMEFYSGLLTEYVATKPNEADSVFKRVEFFESFIPSISSENSFDALLLSYEGIRRMDERGAIIDSVSTSKCLKMFFDDESAQYYSRKGSARKLGLIPASSSDQTVICREGAVYWGGKWKPILEKD
jgi:hypothetical protein